MRFKDLSVLITGAASGFGRLAAERFAAEGARLTLSDISADGLAETAEKVRAKGGEVAAIVGDVSDEPHAKAYVALAISSYGRLDIALNNAGIGGGLATIPEITVENFDRVMAVNARGVFLGMKYEIPEIAKVGGGSILNVASAAGVIGAGNSGLCRVQARRRRADALGGGRDGPLQHPHQRHLSIIRLDADGGEDGRARDERTANLARGSA